MMIKRVAVLVVMVMLLWGTAFSASMPAPQKDHDRPMMMRHMNSGLKMVEQNLYPPRLLQHLAGEIGLTENQLARIREMDAKHQEWTIKRIADARVRGIRLKTLFESKKVDRKALEKEIRAISELQTEIRLARINHLLDVRDLLTPEQIKKIDESKHAQRSRNWRRGMRRNSRLKSRPPRMRD